MQKQRLGHTLRRRDAQHDALGLLQLPDLADIGRVYRDIGDNVNVLVGPNELRPLNVPLGFPGVNEGYLQNPGVWLALRMGGLALYTASDGVRIMTRQTEIFDVAGGCWS